MAYSFTSASLPGRTCELSVNVHTDATRREAHTTAMSSYSMFAIAPGYRR